MTNLEYSRQQLITALQKEYEYLIHDEFDPEEDMSSEDHLKGINSLSVAELKKAIEESILTENCCKEDEDKILFDEFMEMWKA